MGQISMPAARPATVSPAPSYAPGYGYLGNIPYRSAYGTIGARLGGLSQLPSGGVGRPPDQTSFTPAQTLMGQAKLYGEPKRPAGMAPQYNYTPSYSGKATTIPFGQTTSQTWDQLAGMAGVDRSTLDSALGRLAPGVAPGVAAYAQQYMGLATPGDGRGVGPGYFGPPRQASVNTTPTNTATSSYGGTLNAIRQKLGASLPAGFRFQ